MIKLVHGGKNKIVKHSDKSFKELRDIIQSNFPEAPTDYSLSYLDQDKDEICLNSDEDLRNMLHTNSKLHKVYIKQSLSQTIVLDLQRSECVEPSFEETQREVKVQQEPMAFNKKPVEEKEEVEQVKVLQEQAVEDEPAVKVELSQTQMTQSPLKVEEQKVEVRGCSLFKQFTSSAIEKQKEICQNRIEISQVVQVEMPKEEPQRVVSQLLQVAPDNVIVSRVALNEVIGSPKKQEVPKSQDLTKVSRARIFDMFQLQKKPSVEQQLLVHDVPCSSCMDEFVIIGVRYQCILCDNFNLCSGCEDKVEHEHSLVKVKQPQMSITKDMILKKYHVKEVKPVFQAKPLLPPTSYVPSINKEEATLIYEAAKDSVEQGMNRSKRLLDDLFYKLSISHKNPYEGVKPAPSKVETVYEKANYLKNIVSISHNEAVRFVSQYPLYNSEQITQIYFQNKNV